MSSTFTLLTISKHLKISPLSLSTTFSLFTTLCRPARPHFQLSSLDPPNPKKVPFKVTAHGRTWDDPYRWMSNINDPDFVSYLKQENEYAEAFMVDTVGKQRELFVEMGRRVGSKICTPSERWGSWLYYQHIPEGGEYPILCRRLGDNDRGQAESFLSYIKGWFRKEEVLLDWNEIAREYGYVHVGTCRVSPDHNFLAYTLDTTGSEQFMLQVKDLRDGQIIQNMTADGVVSLAWSQDSSTLFYTMSDENQRPSRILCKKVSSDDETAVFTEDDPHFCVDITCTKDGKFITVNSNSRTSSEVYVIDAAKPSDGLRRIHERVPGVQYFVEHHYGVFFVLTNYPLEEIKKTRNGNYYLGVCATEDVCSGNWQKVILPCEGTSIKDMDIFEEHLVLSLEENGCSLMCSIDLPIDNDKHVMEIGDLRPWVFPMPSDLCQIVPGSNHDFMTSEYRVVLSSPVMPDIIVDYDMSARTFSIIHQEEVSDVKMDQLKPDRKTEGLYGWKDFSSTYTCERCDVVSHDGIKIPLTIVYSRDARNSGQSPGLLQAYGAYGEVLDKSWSADRLSLLDRGWVIAFSDVRGGGGGGPSWHKDGSGVNKLNSIYDFASCGKFLVDEGYVKRDKLAAIGYSAGSLLVGATINLYPDLFHAAILKVPFLDICSTLMDPSLPLTILDYEEFGNPQIQSQFEYIMRYSPYDNIAQGSCYPAMLVTASFNDSRVRVWEAAKWVAKIRDNTCKSCSKVVILRTDMNGGHFGEGGRFGQCEEKSYEFTFLMKVMGLVHDVRT